MKTLNHKQIMEMLNRRAVNYAHIDSCKKWSVDSVSTDSRTIKQGSLFVPLKGEHFDGHDYIDQAHKLGAVASLSHKDYEGPCPIIRVADTGEALKKLARSYREDMSLLSVAITGSAGKTTTKELTALALSARYTTFKSEGNKNNEIGLPCEVLKLEQHHTAAVFEMGMSDLGEISELSLIAKPRVAVITNIGSSHIGSLGTKENILKAKLEIIHGLDENGYLLLNADDPLLKKTQNINRNIIYYGISNKEAHVSADDIKSDSNGSSFRASYPGGSVDVKTPLIGMHNVYNCLAALSVAFCADVDMVETARSIEKAKPAKMRQEIYVFADIQIIEDCYNANPDSMNAALEVLGQFKSRRIALLGDMLELGSYAKAEHNRVGVKTAEHCDVLIALGDHANDISNGAIAAGMHRDNIFLAGRAETVALLSEVLQKGDTLLVKASRGMHLEDILTEWKDLHKTKLS